MYSSLEFEKPLPGIRDRPELWVEGAWRLRGFLQVHLRFNSICNCWPGCMCQDWWSLWWVLASLDQWSWAMRHCNSAGTGGRSTGSLSRSATPSEQGEFGSTVIYKKCFDTYACTTGHWHHWNWHNWNWHNWNWHHWHDGSGLITMAMRALGTRRCQSDYIVGGTERCSDTIRVCYIISLWC